MLEHEQYYRKGGTYELPIEIYNDLIGQIVDEQHEIKQLKNIIHEIEEYTHERIKLYKKRLKFLFYHPMRTLHNIWLYERYLNKIKKLKGGKNDKEF